MIQAKTLHNQETENLQCDHIEIHIYRIYEILYQINYTFNIINIIILIYNVRNNVHQMYTISFNVYIFFTNFVYLNCVVTSEETYEYQINAYFV